MDQTASAILALPRPAKRAIAVALDAFLCAVTVWMAFSLRLDEWATLAGVQWFAVLGSLGLAIPIFLKSGLYRAIFRYTGWSALVAIARAVSIYGGLYAAIFTLFSIDGIPRSVGIIQPILLFIFVAISRVAAGYWLGGAYSELFNGRARQNVMVYGAGLAGRQLASALTRSELKVVGFLDDDPALQGRLLLGLPVYDPATLPSLVQRHGLTDILLAIPSASRKRRNEILDLVRELPVAVRTLPGLSDLAQGRVQTTDIRELDVDDLLGREPVPPDEALLQQNVRGKTVLITGAGGSIGSELCRQILMAHPATMLLIEISEPALYSIHQELCGRLEDEGLAGTRLVPLLASAGDPERMRGIMAAWRPDTVYHAAAYKHVPLVEHNPCVGVANNVFGTLTTAVAARETGVSDFVLISTDKAVRPTNIMGTSKRLAEQVLQAMAASSSKTRFSMVRFGNVLDSSGSVVPLFRRQIRNGGPITITHPDITRFFMTIPEAAQLVIQAGAMAEGGEVFVLDMGEPVRIIDLARKMVELSGLRVKDDHSADGDIAIEVIGLRPGEKLYEELLIGDNPSGTSHSRIMKANEHFLPWSKLSKELDCLKKAIDINDVAEVLKILLRLVPEYKPEGNVVDWIHLERLAS